ncbi:hypothetical protein E4Z66_00665 [Aliishimia ponticola]|uniref:Uncharacterized protein n=1 Tax=Aliishimia ponticola TaxID=2499833 RepID=A0A4V3XKT1_9RHOB|nr:hypothetical protein [Aliishimia ponticola]THH38123.1 hypothetical protein E4Z66_00665 [Aliishimia ponticola]
MRNGLLRLAALGMMAAAVLHLIFIGFAGAGEVFYTGLAVLAAAGLWTGWRSIAWAVLLGIIVAMGVSAARIGSDPVPDALLLALVAVDAFAAVCTFFALWRKRAPAD